MIGRKAMERGTVMIGRKAMERGTVMIGRKAMEVELVSSLSHDRIDWLRHQSDLSFCPV